MSIDIPEYEPPNRAIRDEIEALYPSTAPPAGEERVVQDVFPDAG